MVLFLFGVWSTNSKRGKLYYSYLSVDGTVENGWAKVEDKKIKVRGGKFDVLPECVVSLWDRKGIHALFPTRVNYIYLVHYSRYPLNPHDYKRTWDTPELRNMLNLEEQLKSFFKNFTPPKTQKASGLLQYLPLITILLLLVVGFFLYSQQEGMKQVINMMQNQINTVMPR